MIYQQQAKECFQPCTGSFLKFSSLLPDGNVDGSSLRQWRIVLVCWVPVKWLLAFMHPQKLRMLQVLVGVIMAFSLLFRRNICSANAVCNCCLYSKSRNLHYLTKALFTGPLFDDAVASLIKLLPNQTKPFTFNFLVKFGQRFLGVLQFWLCAGQFFAC